MLFHNDQYTQRQREIIKTIGKESRELIKNEKIKALFTYLFYSLVVIILLIIVKTSPYYKNKLEIYSIISIALIITFTFRFILKIKNLNLLKQASDYQIGLYFAPKSAKVVGNANKKIRDLKLSIRILSIILSIITIASFIGGILYNLVDFNALENITGTIEDLTYKSHIEIKLNNDDTIYKIDKLFADELDYFYFKDNAKKEMNIILLCNKLSPENERSVYYVEVEGKVLLSKELVMKVDLKNRNILWIISGVSFSFNILFITIYFKLLNYYKKQKYQEVYNLDFTEEERIALSNSRKNYFSSIDKVKSKSSKGLLIFTIPLFIFGLIFIILGFFEKGIGIYISIGSGLIISFLGGYVSYIILKANVILENNKLKVSGFIKYKEINIEDISLVRVINHHLSSYMIIFDNYGKVFYRVNTAVIKSDEIINVLDNLGVKIEVKS